MQRLIRKKESNGSSVFYRNRGGFLAFLGTCNHPGKFLENGVEYVDVGICLNVCEKRTTCRDYWSRKARTEKSQQLNYTTINPEKIKEELNG